MSLMRIMAIVALNSFQPYHEGDPNMAARYTNGHAGVAYPRNVLEANFLGFSNETKMKLASLYNGKSRTSSGAVISMFENRESVCFVEG